MHLDTAVGRSWVEDAGQGPAVVLLHSLLCDSSMWAAQARDLRRDFRVVTVDGPGHGRSGPPPGRFGLDGCALALVQVLDALAIRQAVVAGLSWGGMTALRAALRAPERVRGLVLLDTSAGVEPGLARLRNRLMAVLYRRVGMGRALEGPVLRAMLGATTLRERPELGRALLDRLRGWDREGVARAIDAVLVRRTSIEADLPRIRAPALVVVGEEDRATGRRAAARIAASIPGARLVHIPRAGHLTALEAPEEVTRLLRGFLAEVETGPPRQPPAGAPAAG